MSPQLTSPLTFPTSGFEVVDIHGSYDCLVQQPLGLTLDQILEMRSSRTFNLELLKPPLRQILASLDYLHRVDIIHTGMAISFTPSKECLKN